MCTRGMLSRKKSEISNIILQKYENDFENKSSENLENRALSRFSANYMYCVFVNVRHNLQKNEKNGCNYRQSGVLSRYENDLVMLNRSKKRAKFDVCKTSEWRSNEKI